MDDKMTVLDRAMKAYHASDLRRPKAFMVPPSDFRPLRRAVKRAVESNGHQFYGGYGVFLLMALPVLSSKKVRRITIV